LQVLGVCNIVYCKIVFVGYGIRYQFSLYWEFLNYCYLVFVGVCILVSNQDQGSSVVAEPIVHEG